MKTLSFFLVAILIINYCFGQTNLFPSSGNVGIGTTNPQAKLHVVGDLRVDGGYYIRSPDGNEAGILQASGEAGTYNGVRIVANRGDGSIIFCTNPSAGTTEIARFANNGNLGIGTTVPQSKLAVNGTVTAKQVKVTQTGWPDDVFQKDHHIPSLDSIETYINRNSRLPGIPSQKDIAKQGLDIGDMQKKQMQKIEELTLYIIEMDKRLNHQDERIRQLQEENNSLKQQLHKIKTGNP